jgi:hypothetical protein
MTDIDHNPENLESRECIIFPRKKDYSSIKGKDISIATNFFKFIRTENSSKTYYTYDIAFVPEIPTDASKLRKNIFRKAKKELDSVLGNLN